MQRSTAKPALLVAQGLHNCRQSHWLPLASDRQAAQRRRAAPTWDASSTEACFLAAALACSEPGSVGTRTTSWGSPIARSTASAARPPSSTPPSPGPGTSSTSDCKHDKGRIHVFVKSPCPAAGYVDRRAVGRPRRRRPRPAPAPAAPVTAGHEKAGSEHPVGSRLMLLTYDTGRTRKARDRPNLQGLSVGLGNLKALHLRWLNSRAEVAGTLHPSGCPGTSGASHRLVNLPSPGWQTSASPRLCGRCRRWPAGRKHRLAAAAASAAFCAAAAATLSLAPGATLCLQAAVVIAFAILAC